MSIQFQVGTDQYEREIHSLTAGHTNSAMRKFNVSIYRRKSSRENLCAVISWVDYAFHIVLLSRVRKKAKHESMKLRIAERNSSIV